MFPKNLKKNKNIGMIVVSALLIVTIQIPFGNSNPIVNTRYNVHGPSIELDNSIYLDTANVVINCSNGKHQYVATDIN
ncbi:hypothetical protein [Candidatus Lokiarchaeum ossiferum]|uniref:hypothetical protein n=1 Tax=Candidatus Lokiarchaeum ossiferum TaxID=2951803 RepID=UPI00352BD6AF